MNLLKKHRLLLNQHCLRALSNNLQNSEMYQMRISKSLRWLVLLNKITRSLKQFKLQRKTQKKIKLKMKSKGSMIKRMLKRSKIQSYRQRRTRVHQTTTTLHYWISQCQSTILPAFKWSMSETREVDLQRNALIKIITYQWVQRRLAARKIVQSKLTASKTRIVKNDFLFSIYTV